MKTTSHSTTTPNATTLTLTLVDLLIGLARLNPSAQHSALFLPLQTHLSTITQNWQDPSALNAFLALQRFIRPAGEMQEWEPALVPAVALLSAALYGRGQVDGAVALVVQVIKARVGGKGGDMSVKAEDVIKVLQELYRRAKKEERESEAKGKKEEGKSKAKVKEKEKTGDKGDVDMKDAE